jgi:hypothetical protein
MSNTLDFTKICSADETNLKKAEILIYSTGKINISKIVGINLPDNSSVENIGNKIIKLNGLSQNFYPILITFWGRIFDDCVTSTKFNMISSLRNNSSNPTSFIFNKDGTMTMQIENINLESSFGVKITNCTTENEKLVAKIIIIYNPCV